MYAHLTVFETLMYSAHFYLPNEVTDEQKAELVTNVISELGLGKVRDTYIGDEKIRGVSGGERKRANIGVQLISDPAVLFLDEPTSGLDSFQAQAVIDSMRAIAHHGRLVITVIHQPRYCVE
jgi:ABC-type multidrug transport system ATPase subunit